MPADDYKGGIVGQRRMGIAQESYLNHLLGLLDRRWLRPCEVFNHSLFELKRLHSLK